MPPTNLQRYENESRQGSKGRRGREGVCGSGRVGLQSLSLVGERREGLRQM